MHYWAGQLHSLSYYQLAEKAERPRGSLLRGASRRLSKKKNRLQAMCFPLQRQRDHMPALLFPPYSSTSMRGTALPLPQEGKKVFYWKSVTSVEIIADALKKRREAVIAIVALCVCLAVKQVRSNKEKAG